MPFSFAASLATSLSAEHQYVLYIGQGPAHWYGHKWDEGRLTGEEFVRFAFLGVDCSELAGQQLLSCPNSQEVCRTGRWTCDKVWHAGSYLGKLRVVDKV